MNEAVCKGAYSVSEIGRLSRQPLTGVAGDAFDYGMALLKTSAALVYTVHLATAHDVAVATDSRAHFALLTHTAQRDGIALDNCVIERIGY
jgi:hypothetical protein